MYPRWIQHLELKFRDSSVQSWSLGLAIRVSGEKLIKGRSPAPHLTGAWQLRPITLLQISSYMTDWCEDELKQGLQGLGMVHLTYMLSLWMCNHVHFSHCLCTIQFWPEARSNMAAVGKACWFLLWVPSYPLHVIFLVHLVTSLPPHWFHSFLRTFFFFFFCSLIPPFTSDFIGAWPCLGAYMTGVMNRVRKTTPCPKLVIGPAVGTSYIPHIPKL